MISRRAVWWMNPDADDDDGVFIELPGLPNRGRLCGYKTGPLPLLPALAFYLTYNFEFVS